MTGYLDSSHMVSQYLLIHSKAVKARIRRYKTKIENWLFYDPSLTPTERSGGGGIDLLSRLSTYGFLLRPNTFYGSKCTT